MTRSISRPTTFFAMFFILFCTGRALAQRPEVGESPWGREDEIGRLNLMTDESREAIVSRVAGGTSYDLNRPGFPGDSIT